VNPAPVRRACSLPISSAGWGRPRVERVSGLRVGPPENSRHLCQRAPACRLPQAPSPREAWRAQPDSDRERARLPGPQAGWGARSILPPPETLPVSEPGKLAFCPGRWLREGALKGGLEHRQPLPVVAKTAVSLESHHFLEGRPCLALLSRQMGETMGSVTSPRSRRSDHFCANPYMRGLPASGAGVQIPVTSRFSHLQNGNKSWTYLTGLLCKQEAKVKSVCARGSSAWEPGRLPARLPRAGTLETRSRSSQLVPDSQGGDTGPTGPSSPDVSASACSVSLRGCGRPLPPLLNGLRRAPFPAEWNGCPAHLEPAWRRLRAHGGGERRQGARKWRGVD
jgi:hypothetical protein